jgi:hypothetical protein
MGVRLTSLDVGAQPQPIDQPRVEAGHGDPGHRDEEDVVHVGGREPRARERVPRRLFTQLERDADPGVVALGKRVVAVVLLDGQRQIAAGHLHRAVQVLDARRVVVLLDPQAAQGGDQRILVGVVLGQGAPDRENGGES